MKNLMIPVTEPIPVHLTYQTAWATKQGEVLFREDIYDRDRVIAEALAITPFAIMNN